MSIVVESALVSAPPVPKRDKVAALIVSVSGNAAVSNKKKALFIKYTGLET